MTAYVPARIVRGKGRVGVYYLEGGATRRPSKVVYDRENSTIALAKPGYIDWDKAFDDAGWFHITGITPAISASAAELSLESARAAKAKGLTVSCDLNFRKNLWKWGKKAAEFMPELVKLTDIAIANEEDVQMALGIQTEVDVDSGQLDRGQYEKPTAKVLAEYPNLRAIAITLRAIEERVAQWLVGVSERPQGVPVEPLLRDHAHRRSRRGGDSFAGGLIYGYQNLKTHQDALEFAVAASCLKHLIPGDFNRFTVDEVNALLKGGGSGRVQR